jgi:hypothetical protein
MPRFTLRVLIATAAPVLIASAATGCGAGGSRTSVPTSPFPIRDDFSGPCHWADTSDDISSTQCVDGGYRIVVKRPQIAPHQVAPRRFAPVAALTVEADVSVPSAVRVGQRDLVFYGVGCWSSAIGQPARGYLFVITVDGSAAIVRQDDTAATKLRPLTTSGAEPSYRQTIPVHLRAECSKAAGTTHLVLLVNGRPAAVADDHDGDGPFRAAGFDTFSTIAGTAVRYDNFMAARAPVPARQ